jgi:rhamnosyltransferase
LAKNEKGDLKMKIAIIGCRGIPAKYGGFETFAHGLTENLAEKGYEITVSCEYKPKKSREDSFKGSKLEYFPIRPPKNYLLRKFYENLSDIYFLLKLSRSNEMIYFLGIEVGMFLFIPKLLNRNSTVMVNIDGVMWERSKFNRLERWLLKLNHDLATRFADTVIADAEAMKNYVDKKYWDKTVYLSYGINPPDRIPWNGEVLKRLKNYTSMNITPGKYFLVVARLEPENNIHTIVDGYSKAEINIPLVIVGDFTSKVYKEQVETLAETCVHPGVIFLGAVYDEDLLNMLRQNCTAYVHGHSVGGTNPSLLEAAISRNIIIAHENQFNSEVCRKSAVYFANETELARKMKLVYRYNENYLDLKNNVYYRVKKNYLWSKITEDYHSLLQEMDTTTKDIKLPAEDLKLIKEDIELIAEDIELISKDSKMIAKDSQLNAEDTKLINKGRIKAEDTKLIAEDGKIA